jgi:hypothetical protein
VTNNSGGTIAGTGAFGVGVSLFDGTVVNRGTISGAQRGISATTANITNYGTVIGTGSAVQTFGISLDNGSISNFGTIQTPDSGGIGIGINANVAVNNAGTIAADSGGGSVGIFVNNSATATINNSGLISATGTGGVAVLVVPGATATITNTGKIIGETGVLLGSGAGTLGSGSTLVNAGTIIGTGGVAIDSQHARHRQRRDPRFVLKFQFGSMPASRTNTPQRSISVFT